MRSNSAHKSEIAKQHASVLIYKEKLDGQEARHLKSPGAHIIFL